MNEKEEFKLYGFNNFEFVKQCGGEMIEAKTGIEMKRKPDHIEEGYGGGYLIMIYSSKKNSNKKYTIFANDGHEPDEIGSYTLVKIFAAN